MVPNDSILQFPSSVKHQHVPHWSGRSAGFTSVLVSAFYNPKIISELELFIACAVGEILI